ncbi:MAG: hypothetical protein M1834_002630 [Cirrosporium novae-zelandiae]|nr:MAG: hypothetical protein M1834_002630 [Cirrosporium novae-zelandiae]
MSHQSYQSINLGNLQDPNPPAVSPTHAGSQLDVTEGVSLSQPRQGPVTAALASVGPNAQQNHGRSRPRNQHRSGRGGNAVVNFTSTAGGSKPGGGKLKGRKCSFFGTKNGCRAGDACAFIHDISPASPQLQVSPHARNDTSRSKAPQSQRPSASQVSTAEAISQTAQSQLSTNNPNASASTLEGRRYNAQPVPSRIVSKPVSRVQRSDPRTFQLNQLRRRFSPKETELQDGMTELRFVLAPSDPDFPFELGEGLQCVLRVPKDFSDGDNSRPTLRITNEAMERGWQIKVESGFDEIVERKPKATLLEWLKVLDRELEGLLMGKKAETFKIVVNQAPSKAPEAPRTVPRTIPKDEGKKKQVSQPAISIPVPRYSAEQLASALQKRESDIRQLEGRLGRLPLFSKSVLADKTIYIIPINPQRKTDLPVPLQDVNSIKLFVPQLYDLEPCTIEILGVSRDAAKNTERSFVKKGSEKGTLMTKVNWLAAEMWKLAVDEVEAEHDWVDISGGFQEPEISEATATKSDDKGKGVEETATKSEDKGKGVEDDRSHIKVIPRPPEWSFPTKEDGDEDVDSESTSSTSDSEAPDIDEGVPISTAPLSQPERGISLSFPSLELHGIELLELSVLNLTVKCERCKAVLDIKGIKPDTKERVEGCAKCGGTMTVGFRKEFMHPGNTRAGFIDMSGAVVVDMLPSTFLPTCSTCSTTLPSPGIVSVRGDTSLSLCHGCHAKLTLTLPDLKFLAVSAATLKPLPPRRRRPRENLGIVAGTELEKRGRCSHYSKSYRWFRFKCCGKVFPCDRCHDASEDHATEWANRMICGFCSREQTFHPEVCTFCRKTLIGKAGSGFWEGGKGTRDPVKMSRKDPRKYRHRSVKK